MLSLPLSLSLSLSLSPALQSRNLRELSSTVVLSMFEYKDHQHIHETSSPSLRARDLPIPVLAVNSADDPFCPPHGGWGYLPVLEVTVYSV